MKVLIEQSLTSPSRTELCQQTTFGLQLQLFPGCPATGPSSGFCPHQASTIVSRTLTSTPYLLHVLLVLSLWGTPTTTRGNLHGKECTAHSTLTVTPKQKQNLVASLRHLTLFFIDCENMGTFVYWLENSHCPEYFSFTCSQDPSSAPLGLSLERWVLLIKHLYDHSC